MVFVYSGGQTLWQASWGSRAYNIRSTVLGGRVVYRYRTNHFSSNNGTNSFSTGFDTKAYLHGSVLASYQWNSSNSDPNFAHTVRWYHADPSNTTIGETAAPPLSPTIWRRTELDPMRADVGTENPYPQEPSTYPPPYETFEFASPENVERCVLDGVDFSCSRLQRLIEVGAVQTQYPGLYQRSPYAKPDVTSSPWPVTKDIHNYGLGIFEIWMPSEFRGNDRAAGG